VIRVEVAYARPERQILRTVELDPGATVRMAVVRSGIPAECPEVDPDRSRVGIHGRVVAPDAVVEDGDRVEIYRPLRIDPKEARRLRAAIRNRRKSAGTGPGGNEKGA
jgi:putative ubiquitin-RnfH superfamily antitoxin RatB of RatAB toxin-antitoxin module